MLTNSSQLQNSYLDSIHKNNVQVSLYLVNGIKLSGYIAGWDEVCIILKDKNDSVTQLIYKHAISTVIPVKALQ